jgi:hypothetical protein
MTIGTNAFALSNPSDDFVTQLGWKEIGRLFDIHAVLGAGELDDATVAALAANGLGQVVVFKPENGTVAVEFRFSGYKGAGTGPIATDTFAIEIYRAAGVDYYQKVGKLTVTLGTAQRELSTSLFASNIVETEAIVWLTADTIVVPTAANQIATVGLNMHGSDRFAFMVSASDADMDPATPGTADEGLLIEARRF